MPTPAQPQGSETDTHAKRAENLDPVYQTACTYRMFGRCRRAKIRHFPGHLENGEASRTSPLLGLSMI